MSTVKTKKTGNEKNETAAAIREAATIATADTPVQPTAVTKIVTVRLTEYEYNELTSAYAKHGVKLSTGLKTAAIWL